MELTLSTGAHLRVRPMSQHILQQVGGREEAKIDPAPAPATVKKTSPLTGGTEAVPAGEGDPEYDEWIKAMEDWTARTQEARAGISQRLTSLMFDFGIIAWCWDCDVEDPESAEWLDEAPEDWEFPPALLRAGLEPSDNRRLDYILIEVIPRPLDYRNTLHAIRTETTLITDEEVAAQRAGFRLPGELEGAAQGLGDRAVEVPRGAGGRKKVGLVARLLGKGVKG